MKKNLSLLVFSTMLLAVSAHSFIIWDFDSTATTPATVVQFGYIYAYVSSANTNGIGGSNACIVEIPLNSSRGHGGGFDLSNVVGWTSASTIAIDTTPNTGDLDLSLAGNNTVYWSVMANNTSNNWGGIAFAAYDTSTVNAFVPNGVAYSSSSAQLTTISTITSGFQMVSWNLSNFHIYKPATTTGRAPALHYITAFEWYFPSSVGVPTGYGGGSSGPPVLQVWLDNVGVVGSKGPADMPVELTNFEAYGISNSDIVGKLNSEAIDTKKY